MYEINKQICSGCQICIQSCPKATKIGVDGKAEVVDQEKLKSCGGESLCPFGAIEEIDKKNIKKIAEENFKRWNKVLQTNNSYEVAKLYEDNSSFLPTLSGDFKKGKNGAMKYFEHFLQEKPVAEIIKSEVQESEDGKTLIHSGMYNFKVEEKNNQKIIQARFTFVWQKNKKGEWKIIHHHSSLKP